MTRKLGMQKPFVLKGEVTQEDIDNGTPCKGTKCPLKISVARTLGVAHGYVHVDSSGIKITRLKTYREAAFLPRRMKNFLIDYDARRPVCPFKWTLYFYQISRVTKETIEKRELVKKMRALGKWSSASGAPRSRIVGLSTKEVAA